MNWDHEFFCVSTGCGSLHRFMVMVTLITASTQPDLNSLLLVNNSSYFDRIPNDFFSSQAGAVKKTSDANFNFENRTATK